MELPVHNAEGQKTGTIEISDALVASPMNNPVVHQALVGYQANQRQGTQSVLTRSEVSGGGKKPWGQKYTGNARQGSTRAPQWRHGGIIHAPKPRDYRVKLPKRLRHLALRSVLSAKVREGKLTVIQDFGLSKVSTKDMAKLLQALGVTTSVLVVHNASNENLVASARNIEKAYTLPTRLLNAWDLLRRDRVVITADAMKEAETLWAQERPRGGVAVAEPAEAKVETKAAPAKKAAAPRAAKPKAVETKAEAPAKKPAPPRTKKAEAAVADEAPKAAKPKATKAKPGKKDDAS